SALLGAGDRSHQRGDAADGDTPVLPLRRGRVHLQILLAIALRRQVFRRNAEGVGQGLRNGFGAPVGQREIGIVGTDGVGVAFDQEGFRRVFRQQLFHRGGDAFQFLHLAVGNRRRAELEGQRIEVDAAGDVAHAGGALDLLDRVEALDPFHRRLFQEFIIVVGIFDGFGVQDIPVARDGEAHRRQVVAGIAPLAAIVIAPLVDIVQHVFAPVRCDARALDDVAVAVADGDDPVAIASLDGFAGAPARQVFIIDVLGAMGDARAVVAFDHGAAAKLDDDAVADLLQNVHAVAALAFSPIGRLVAALAFFLGYRLDLFRLYGLLGCLVVGRRRTLVGGRRRGRGLFSVLVRGLFTVALAALFVVARTLRVLLAVQDGRGVGVGRGLALNRLFALNRLLA